LSTQISNLPALFLEQLTQHNQQEKQAKEERRGAVREEKKQAKAARQREAECKELANRFAVITNQSDTFRIASLTIKLTEELQNKSGEHEPSAVALPQYLDLVAKADGVRSKLDGFGNKGTAEEVEHDLKELERACDELDGFGTKPALFIGLLEEASRHQTLQDKADELKRLLNLEDITVEPGSQLEPKDMGVTVKPVDAPIIGSSGGTRMIVQEVVERGYRLKDNGLVIRPAKVSVRLEN
jgi:hypothetical protein